MRATSILVAACCGVALAATSACRRGSESTSDASTTSEVLSTPQQAATAEPGAVRPGMAWIPPGTLRAGTPVDRPPRVADEELGGDAIEMGGFYIDLLPYPNEPGAIPMSNVTRDEAAQLCSAKGKRLCAELEWERACKGPRNTTYEYGDAYRAASCGTGASSEEAARRPTDEHAQCKSGFGVADMHGGVWEWTDSPWGRTSKDASLGVLRGGNAIAGELVGRCANAIGRPTSKKAPAMGFRCCAGPKNAAEVRIALTSTPKFEAIGTDNKLHDMWESAMRPAMGVAANNFARAWKWVPVPNEELTLIVACNRGASCTLGIGRVLDGRTSLVTSVETGARPPDLLRLGDVRHLRLRGIDPSGTFGRDISYVYGRVEIAAEKRP